MQRVTLYTTMRRVVTSHSGYIPVASRSGSIIPSRNSPDLFISDEIKVDHLPIKRFCFTQENGVVDDRFVAFDRELEEIIQVMLDDYTRDLQYGYKKAHDRLTEAFETHIKALKSRTIWDMMKLKFSEWWLK